MVKPLTFNKVEIFPMTGKTRSDAFNSAADTAGRNEAELEKRLMY